MIFYLLLYMFYKYNIKQTQNFKLHQDLSNNENTSFHSSNQYEYTKGFDMRPIKKEEPPLELLIDLHEKQKRMLKLCDNNYSLYQREIWACEYLQENETMSFNVEKGGLLDDWDFNKM